MRCDVIAAGILGALNALSTYQYLHFIYIYFWKLFFKILWNYYRIGCCLLKLNLNCDLIFFLILIILIFNVELNYSSKGLRVIILSSPNKLMNFF